MPGAVPGAGERQVVLSLGSNLGDRLANLQGGTDALAAGGLRITAVSSVYQTSPVGGPEQPDYLNAVLLASSALACREILRRCLEAERALGRVREVRWGPRTLDVDIIACGAEMSDDPELTLPHPRAHERMFVLVPWHELDPGAHLAGAGPVADLIGQAETHGVHLLAGPGLRLPATQGAGRSDERGANS